MLDSLSLLPDALQARVQLHWEAYQKAVNERKLEILQQFDFLQSVAKVWAGSEFIALQCIRGPEIIAELFLKGDILKIYNKGNYVARLTRLLSEVNEVTALKKVLRLFRNREIIRIIWRDLAGWANFNDTTGELTELAEACIDQTARKLYTWQGRYDGKPALYKNRVQNLLIIALGKLGGRELNLSSDVDLLFAYATRGETQGAKKSLSHEQFFNRLGRDLIQVLNQATSEGFVYRVDMRLRPFGESGPLVMHFSALKHYYEDQGRDWERYALMKARLISGDPIIGSELMEILRSFVYRRYVDYSAIEALRKMYHSIVEEVKNKKLEDNIKLGYGGIREIEFICQAYQFIWGGENTWLQDRRLLRVLKLLAQMEIIPSKKATDLEEAYCFLRTLENRLQSVADRQIHQLPTQPLERLRIAYVMGFESWQAFRGKLQAYLDIVDFYFGKLVAKPDHEQVILHAQLHDEVASLWLNRDEEDSETTLTKMGYKDREKVLALLNVLRSSRQFKKISQLGQERLNALMPILLMNIGKTDQPEITLQRLLDLLLVMIRRSAYMVLLLENPKALEQLVKLCAVSPWIAELVSRYPLLLGELLDTKRLYAPLDLTTLQIRMNQLSDYIASEDIAAQIENLRRFKLYHVFRVAAMDVTGVLPLMRVSDHLTNIAQVVLAAIQIIVWRQLVARYGYPVGENRETTFAVVAYGKFGGIELGYSSDLDLVFIYDNDPQKLTRAKKGQEAIPHSVFYIRLAQQLVQLLSAWSTSGTLYEVDTRLRPSGESGLLATSLNTFEQYEQHEAWTWEHQALVRARIVCGTKNIEAKFAAIRRKVLVQRRKTKKLAKEVKEMRAKMRTAAESVPQGQFDLKQGLGGIADIEFIVQYGVLKWAADYPTLLVYTDNIRILEALANEKLINMDDMRILSDAYRAYRAIAHRLDLQNQPAYVANDQLRSYRAGVITVWRKVIG